MIDGRPPWPHRPSVFVAILTCLLAMVAAPPAWAQRTPAEIDRAVAALETQLDALQNGASAAGISRQLDAVSRDLADVKRAVQNRAPVQPAPPDAWRAIALVGGLFAAAWAFVSLLRESSRQHEAIMQAVVKYREKEPQDATNEQFKTQIAQLQNLLVESADGPMSLSGVLRRLFNVKR
jgi:hypothetical protein